MRIITLVLVIAFCAACESDNGGQAAGTAGGACYGNGTCNEGLLCLSDKCVKGAILADVVEWGDPGVTDVDGQSDESENDVGADTQAVDTDVQTPDTLAADQGSDDPGCMPKCDGRECGDDGCGGSCGECPGQQDTCQEGGVCHCEASCEGKECGPDGCGGSCGVCISEICTSEGTCGCAPACEGKQCGQDGCGGSCGTCAEATYCDFDGLCACETGGVECEDICCNSSQVCAVGVCCTPNCTGKECGDDGCGGTCGSCEEADMCAAGSCVPIFQDSDDDGDPDGTDCSPSDPTIHHGAIESCNNEDDDCDGQTDEGASAACTVWEICLVGECTCVPECVGIACGSDGCGGSCGSCSVGQFCSNGQCVVSLQENGNGTLTDLVTGLHWQEIGSPTQMGWALAASYCEDNTAGLPGDGWRLPSISELRSLIRGCEGTVVEADSPVVCDVSDECPQYVPPCWLDSCDGCQPYGGPSSAGCYWDPLVGNGTSGKCDWYWSSTLVEPYGHEAWGVAFFIGALTSGFLELMPNQASVRCVRSQ